MGNNDAVAPPGNNNEEHRLIRSLIESVLLADQEMEKYIHDADRKVQSPTT